MKFRKIIALSLSALMVVATSVANAAYLSEDGAYVSDAVVTKAELQARTPQLTVTSEKILQNDAKSIGSVVTIGANKEDDTNKDFYKVTFTVNNLGELFAAYKNDGNYETWYGVKVYNVDIQVPNAANAKITLKNQTLGGKAWATGGTGILWTATSTGIDDCYPLGKGDTPEELGGMNQGFTTSTESISLVALFTLDKNATFTDTPTCLVTYQTYDPPVAGNGVKFTCAANALNLSAPAPAVVPEQAVTFATPSANAAVVSEGGNYFAFAKTDVVWDTDALAKYVVKATATDNATKEWSLFAPESESGAKDGFVDYDGKLENIIKNGEFDGSTSFYVVVKSAKELSKVEIIKLAD